MSTVWPGIFSSPSLCQILQPSSLHQEPSSQVKQTELVVVYSSPSSASIHLHGMYGHS